MTTSPQPRAADEVASTPDRLSDDIEAYITGAPETQGRDVTYTKWTARARQLERELAGKDAELSRLKRGVQSTSINEGAIDALRIELATRTAENAALRRDKERLDKIEMWCLENKRVEFALGVLRHGIELGISYPIELRIRDTIRAAIDAAPGLGGGR